MLDGTTVVGGCLLVERAGHALPAARTAPRSTKPEAVRYTMEDICGDSPVLASARATAAAAAGTDLPVLLLGESGTGKEVFAQAIHAASPRRDKPFIAVNCAALPRELVESELFGYEGGAFSGARKEGTIGKLEAAEGGTILLDEVAELPPAAQAALLRALQENEIQRVGSVKTRRVDVRVIAATNRDIQASLASGALRQDLYYRLNVIPIELPPLRERPGDVRRLARRFFEATARELGVTEVTVDAEVFDAFSAYPWPGNVRELKNLVRRLVMMTGAVVRFGDLPQAIRSAASGVAQGPHAVKVAVNAGALADRPRGRAAHGHRQQLRHHGGGRRAPRHHPLHALPAHGALRALAQAGGGAEVGRGGCRVAREAPRTLPQLHS